MGCDIHPILERKWTQPDGSVKWVGIHNFPLLKNAYAKEGDTGYCIPRAQCRNYDLFARLAGVRGDGPEPRGLPDDASELVRMEFPADHGDYHSHSWTTAREWVEACLASEDDPAKLFLEANKDDPRVKDPYAHYLDLDIMEDEEDEEWKADSYRVVFCFDN
jgi:hypothetical protein